ncbi:MAG: apolipoprotein N-acyltransferase, partial [Actinomycetota bacterium]
PRPGDATGSVDVAAVQGNVPKAGLDFNAERRAVLDNHAAATRELARAVADGRARPPDLVVWPENSSDIDPLRNPDAAAVISGAVDAVGVPLLLGTVLQEPADKLSNVSMVWEPGKGPGQQYVKRRPVPFAEYVPYRSFFRRISDKVDLVRRDFVAGTGPNVLTVGPATVGTAICFEVAFDDLLREAVRGGADLLVVQTNNATFGRTDESVQQLAMSRLRAVELGRSVVHISTVGVSALITPTGDMVEVSDHFTAETLTASLPLRGGLTVAARLGAWPEGLLVLVGLAGAALGLRAGRGRRPAARERGTTDGAVRRRDVLLQAGGTMVLATGCSGSPRQPEAGAIPTTPPARLLEPGEFAAAVEDDDRFLLNVHTPDEGSIPGTDAAIPFDELRTRADELPPDRGTPLAVYCKTGRMSAIAVQTLAGIGYQDLVELDGGMVAWERAFPDGGSA